jgi:hypothetical protein
MIPVIAKQDTSILPAGIWLDEAMARFDVVAALTSALPACWTVEREFDPDGDLSIVVFPTCDEPAQPSLVLYEDNGFVAVATIIGDIWRGKRTFPTCRRAVDAIVATAMASSG